MKLHLPKLLLTAVLGMTATTFSAVADTPNVFASGMVSTEGSKEYANQTISITGNDSGGRAIYVAGDNASLSLDNVIVTGIGHFYVGYVSSDGKMLVDNKSHIDVSEGGTFVLGYATSDAAAFSELTVKGGSSIQGTYNNFWIFNGTLNIEGAGSTVKTCGACNCEALSEGKDEPHYNYRALLGYFSNNTAEINIKDGGKYINHATQFVANYYSKTTVNINVAGANSSFVQSANTENLGSNPMGYTGMWSYKTTTTTSSATWTDEEKEKYIIAGNKPADRYDAWADVESYAYQRDYTIHAETVTYLCDSGTNKHGLKEAPVNNVVTNISVTDGGEVRFDSIITYVGSFQDRSMGYTNKMLNIYVDEDSSLSFKRLEMYADTTVTSAGGVKVDGHMNIFKDATLTFNLTQANQNKPVFSLSANSVVSIKGVEDIIVNQEQAPDDQKVSKSSGPVTFAFTATENQKAGRRYILFDGYDKFENIDDIKVEGVDAELSEQNGQIILTLTDGLFVARDPLADVVQAANWGVYHSSQAFTSMLWAPHTNAVKLTSPGTDEKGIALPTQPVGYTLAWASVYSSFAEHCGSNGFADMDYSIVGGAVGVEHRFAGGSSIGIAFGYDWGKASPKGLNNVDQESMHAALYGRAFETGVSRNGKLALDWSAAVGQTESDHKLACCDWTQNSMQLDARLSYIHAVSERTAVNAFVGMQYYAQDDDSTDRIEADSMQNLRAQFGVGVSHQVCEKAVVFAEASVYRDIMRHNPEVNVDGFYYGSGANPGRTGGNITVGAEYSLTPNWTLRGSYGFEIADHLQQHSANVGAVYSF